MSKDTFNYFWDRLRDADPSDVTETRLTELETISGFTSYSEFVLNALGKVIAARSETHGTSAVTDAAKIIEDVDNVNNKLAEEYDVVLAKLLAQIERATSPEEKAAQEALLIIAQAQQARFLGVRSEFKKILGIFEAGDSEKPEQQ